MKPNKSTLDGFLSYLVLCCPGQKKNLSAVADITQKWRCKLEDLLPTLVSSKQSQAWEIVCWWIQRITWVLVHPEQMESGAKIFATIASRWDLVLPIKYAKTSRNKISFIVQLLGGFVKSSTQDITLFSLVLMTSPCLTTMWWVQLSHSLSDTCVVLKHLEGNSPP